MNIVFHQEGQDWAKAAAPIENPDETLDPMVMSAKGMCTYSVADVCRLHKIGRMLRDQAEEQVPGISKSVTTQNTFITPASLYAFYNYHLVRSRKEHEWIYGSSMHKEFWPNGGQAAIPRWDFSSGICTVSWGYIRVWSIRTVTAPIISLLNTNIVRDYNSLTSSGYATVSSAMEQLGVAMRDRATGMSFSTHTGRMSSGTVSGADYGTTAYNSYTYGESLLHNYMMNNQTHRAYVNVSDYMAALGEFQVPASAFVEGRGLADLKFKTNIGRLLFECTRAALRIRQRYFGTGAPTAVSDMIPVATGLELVAIIPIGQKMSTRTLEYINQMINPRAAKKSKKRRSGKWTL